MPIAYVASTTTSGTSGNSMTLTVPSGTAAGDIIVASLIKNHSATIAAFTWPAGWTVLDAQTGGPDTSVRYSRIEIAWKAWQSGETSYTVTGVEGASFSGHVGHAHTYSGVHQTTPVIQHSLGTFTTVANTTETVITTPTVTDATAGLWRTAFFGCTGLSTSEIFFDSYSPADTERADVVFTPPNYPPTLAYTDSNTVIDASSGTSVTATPQDPSTFGSSLNIGWAGLLQSSAEAKSGTDTASAAESSSISTTQTLADTSSASDSSSILAAQNSSDTSSTADSQSVSALLPGGDTASSVDVSSVAATLPSSDIATATDGIQVLSDSFNRANSASSLGVADFGGSWVASVGTLGISSNAAYAPTFANNQAVINAGTPNVSVSLTINATGTQRAGIHFRGAAANSYLDCWRFERNTDGNLILHRVIGGSVTSYTTAVSATTGDVIRVDAYGNYIACYKNNAFVISKNDSANSTNTRMGIVIVETGSTVENFSISIPQTLASLSNTDTAASVDSQSITAATLGTDTSTSVESQSISATRPGADTSTATETTSISATQPSADTLLASDDIAAITDTFTRADNATSLGNTETGQPWVNFEGSAASGIFSNQAYSTSNSTKLVSVGANVSVQMTVSAMDATSGFYLSFRFSSFNDEWRWRNTGSGNMTLYKVVAGVPTAVGATHNGAVTAGSVLRVDAFGNSIKAYVNGVLLTSTIDSHNSTATNAGFRSLAGFGTVTRFDNFSFTIPQTLSSFASADVSSSADTGTIAATLPGSDLVSALDSSSLLVGQPGADTSTSVESHSLVVMVSSADTVTAVEIQLITQNVVSSDVVTAVERGYNGFGLEYSTVLIDSYWITVPIE